MNTSIEMISVYFRNVNIDTNKVKTEMCTTVNMIFDKYYKAC